MNELVTQLTTNKMMLNLIDQLRPAFKNLPNLPENIVDFLVKIAPWLAGIGGVFGVLSGISMISDGLGMGTSWMAEYAGFPTTYFLVVGVLHLLMGVIGLLAFSPLKNLLRTGWLLMFWTMAISLIQSLVAVVFGLPVGGVVMTVICLAVGLYILFEVEPRYN